MSLNSSFNSLVHVINEFMIFLHLGALHMTVHFGIVDKLAVLPIVKISFIDRPVKSLFPIERKTYYPMLSSLDCLGIHSIIEAPVCIEDRIEY